MSNTPENCEKLADNIVRGMSIEELQQFVFDDVYSIMLEDKEIYESNLDTCGEI